MNPALDYYERIVERVVLRADDFAGGEDYGLFKHKDSMHTHTTAYGLPQVRHVCFCGDKVEAVFQLKEVHAGSEIQSRYVFKLSAAWRDWRKYEHPGTIRLNGMALHDEGLFLENVCKGWPSQYLDIPNRFLRQGTNTLEIVNGSKGGNVLLIERVEILRHPDICDFTVFHCPDFANVGTPFSVGLHLLQGHPGIHVACDPGLEFLGHEAGEFHFQASRPGQGFKIVFSDGGLSTEASVADIFPEKPDKVLVGFDGDDIRHDELGEMDRCLGCLTHTQMGNFVIYRGGGSPRNTPPSRPPSAATWNRWFDFCEDNGITYQINNGHTEGVLSRCGFDGFQMHEPYLIFQPMSRKNAPPFVEAAKTLDECRESYVRYLSERADKARDVHGGGRVYYGDPSLLTAVHMRDVNADGVFCEPVSNSSLLYGAARGSGKEFGAHIPADWYLGYPHDMNAVRRFRLLLHLAYTFGGNRIYVESTAFKTNAFSRNDREDLFCRQIRDELRAFYKFACSDSRAGSPDVPLALIYGNNESLLWRHDDRIAEMVDHEDWDTVAWGKFKDTAHRRMWLLADAWLPCLDDEDRGKDESLTRMFTGSPYGAVDVVLPDSDLSRHQAVAFTGWNSMSEAIYENLLSYVRNGGTLFIGGCHFDTRAEAGSEFAMFRDGRIAELVGADVLGVGETVFGKYRTGRLELHGAREKGDFLLEFQNGKGKVIFHNFLDYPCDPRLIATMRRVLEEIGAEVAERGGFSVRGKDAPKVNITRWQDKLYLSNVDWRNGIEIVVAYGDDEIPVSLKSAETTIIRLGNYRKGSI